MGARLLSKDPPEYALAAEYLRKALRRRWKRLGYQDRRSATSLLLLWEAEIGLGNDVEVNQLAEELRTHAFEPIEWDSSMGSRLIKTARFLAAGGHDESAIFVIEQALIAGVAAKGIPAVAEFRPLSEEQPLQDLIHRYTHGEP